jgi:hypothetical protein
MPRNVGRPCRSHAIGEGRHGARRSETQQPATAARSTGRVPASGRLRKSEGHAGDPAAGCCFLHWCLQPNESQLTICRPRCRSEQVRRVQPRDACDARKRGLDSGDLRGRGGAPEQIALAAANALRTMARGRPDSLVARSECARHGHGTCFVVNAVHPLARRRRSSDRFGRRRLERTARPSAPGRALPAKGHKRAAKSSASNIHRRDLLGRLIHEYRRAVA